MLSQCNSIQFNSTPIQFQFNSVQFNFSGPLWDSLGLSGPLWAFLGLSGHPWASLGTHTLYIYIYIYTRAVPHISMCGITSLGFCGLDFSWPDATFVYRLRFRFRSDSESPDSASDSEILLERCNHCLLYSFPLLFLARLTFR